MWFWGWIWEVICNIQQMFFLMLALLFHRKDTWKGMPQSCFGQQSKSYLTEQKHASKIKWCISFSHKIIQCFVFLFLFIFFLQQCKSILFLYSCIYKLNFCSTHLKLCEQIFKVNCKYVNSLNAHGICQEIYNWQSEGVHLPVTLVSQGYPCTSIIVWHRVLNS